ncbi:hypothetical protein V2H45_05890 [Tumidithrix elongata RA019]|uniref:Uncharacterized protein n=1 Tax=Tumidithrix elongata BACA0141 TaxID=2716417 RepID=A0AAW9PR33_9CYAN|nr:hypothetical protein [Tumidithrix elongata RA019]
MVKYIGLGLMILGIYLLGKTITFNTVIFNPPFSNLLADLSIPLLLGGIATLFFGGLGNRNYALTSIVGSFIAMFSSGFIVVRSINLWDLVLGFGAIFAGGYLFMTDKADLD